MHLLTIAYPELLEKDYQHIEIYREQNDRFFSIVRPHFTLVFPVNEVSIEKYVAEIKKQINGFHSISFCLRCSTINKDAFNESYHAFLVPDEGFSQIVKLHDRLYDDNLLKYRRFDLDFIPHIGIGNSPDKMLGKKMADDWNANDFSISGIISSVDIVKFENEKVESIEKINLNRK